MCEETFLLSNRSLVTHLGLPFGQMTLDEAEGYEVEYFNKDGLIQPSTETQE
jgi:hypothetical protein